MSTLAAVWVTISPVSGSSASTVIGSIVWIWPTRMPPIRTSLPGTSVLAFGSVAETR